MNEQILKNNDVLKERANNVLVGGVSAAWNYLKEKGPVYFRSGEGAHIRDVDGNEYIDYLIGWGSLFLGHNPKVIRDALEKSIRTGFGFQYESEYHIELAELITDIIPCAEKVRLCNSGTEATMNAIRLARIKTKKKK